MLADITWDSLLSGLIGVFVGAILSGVIAWWLALKNARDILRGKLLALKTCHFIDTTEKAPDHFQRFRSSYPDILAAILAYRSLVPPDMRGKIDDALYCYRGDKKGELKKVPYVKYTHIDVSDQLDFDSRIERLLEAIESID